MTNEELRTLVREAPDLATLHFMRRLYERLGETLDEAERCYIGWPARFDKLDACANKLAHYCKRLDNLAADLKELRKGV